jgi:phosphatidylglycerophosphatase A
VGFPIEIEFKIEESAGPSELSSELSSEFSEGGGDIGEAEVAPVELGIGRGSRWIAVAGGLGYVPLAPGTAGSFGGVLLFLLFVSAGAGLSRGNFLALYALLVGSLLVLGIRAAGRAEVDFGRRDDGRIVIDEVVGQLIALIPLAMLLPLQLATSPAAPTSPAVAHGDLFLLFPEVVTGFVLFRLFDVWKPGAVRWAECRFEGGLGVMADDVVAGLYAGLCLFVLQLLGLGLGFEGHGFEGFFSASVSSSVSSVSWAAVSVSA